jgi:hypothetical protein
MIAQFITLGDFEDPFNEFFVDKMVSTKNRDHIAYRLCDKDKIPLFLQDIAHTIFKLGGDVHLLSNTKNRLFNHSAQNAYFAICNKPL